MTRCLSDLRGKAFYLAHLRTYFRVLSVSFQCRVESASVAFLGPTPSCQCVANVNVTLQLDGIVNALIECGLTTSCHVTVHCMSILSLYADKEGRSARPAAPDTGHAIPFSFHAWSFLWSDKCLTAMRV